MYINSHLLFGFNFVGITNQTNVFVFLCFFFFKYIISFLVNDLYIRSNFFRGRVTSSEVIELHPLRMRDSSVVEHLYWFQEFLGSIPILDKLDSHLLLQFVKISSYSKKTAKCPWNWQIIINHIPYESLYKLPVVYIKEAKVTWKNEKRCIKYLQFGSLSRG